MTLSIRKWDCKSCGATNLDKDENAAKNIEYFGLTKLLGEEHSLKSVESSSFRVLDEAEISSSGSYHLNL